MKAPTVEPQRGTVRRIPELDGLRGLAVVAVVAYHAWPETVPGGWLGVSVFFTLSGFLITGILVRDHEPTGPSLARFWMTRARRLLPAALLTIAAVVVGTALVDPDSVRRVAGDALASIWYVQNWREAAAPGGYGAIFDDGLRPLGHMWSLSIEEQVYLALPLLTLWLGPRRMLVAGGLVAGIGTVGWWGSPDAYYATPVRLTEVLAGAALAVWIAEGRRVRVPVALGALAGAALLAGVAVLGESDDLVARGGLPLAALASVLVLATVHEHRVGALCGAPLRWLGHRSYAIYLFHWPLLVLLDAPAWLVVVLTALLAELSHRLVEWPIRSRRVVVRRPAATFAGATAVAVVVAGTALVLAPRPASDAEIAGATAAALRQVAVDPAPPDAAPPDAAPPDAAGDGTAPTVRSSPTTAPAVSSPTVPTDTAAPDPPPDPRIPIPPAPTVMVLGESTAHAIEPALSGWVSVIGGTPVDASSPGCSPLFDRDGASRWSTKLTPDPTACRTAPAAGTDLVIVFDHGVPLFDHLDRGVGEWTDLTDPAFAAEMTAAYETLIAQAAAVGAQVVFTTPPVPWPAFGEWAGWHTGTEVERRLTYTALVTDLAERYDHVHLLEFGPFVDADPARYPREDGIHLDADTGAVHAVVDLVAPAFRSAAG